MIYLVTDSTACLTRREANELRALVVPMHYITGGKPTPRVSLRTGSQSPDRA